MKVSVQWLSEYVDLQGVTVEQLAEKMTESGIEVGAIKRLDEGLTNVVVGYVETKQKHPQADKLNVCMVDVGEEESIQIVCGASNVAIGQKVPVALIGAKLPSDGSKIKKTKLRGVTSHGMICSAKELGLNEKMFSKEQQTGIFILPDQVPLGQSIGTVLGLEDTVIELELTPNRSDCLSMLGVAYEVGAIFSREVSNPTVENCLMQKNDGSNNSLDVNVLAADCHHYAIRYVKDIKVFPSPLWMQNRLIACGIRPINNVVDITNYVMLEYGQPLHAFDADQLDSKTMYVRYAQKGEDIITLDGQQRNLEQHMLVIADRVKPIAIAGVMGGANTQVMEKTINVILESAKFSGKSISKTSRLLGLRSESSLRFEKEVNADNVIPALNRAAQLMQMYASGIMTEGIVEQVIQNSSPPLITLSVHKLNQYLGTELSVSDIEAIFHRLKFVCTRLTEQQLQVQVPSRRGHITLDVHLIEEVARLYGYESLPVTQTVGIGTVGTYTAFQMMQRCLRQLLIFSGWQESITYSFVHPHMTTMFPRLIKENYAVKLDMPMSEDRSMLRTSIIPQLLSVAEYNLNRQNPNVALFEIGHVFYSEQMELTKQPHEPLVISLLLMGNRPVQQWNMQEKLVDFFDLKATVEQLLRYLGLEDEIDYVSEQIQGMHPGRAACIYVKRGQSGEREFLGTLGQVHPQLQRAYGVHEVYAAEILLGVLHSCASSSIRYEDLPKYPPIHRDIAIVVEESTPASKIVEAVTEYGGQWLQRTRIFDVFTSEKLGHNKKSIAMSLTFRHPERTLNDKEISDAYDQIVLYLNSAFGAVLRQ